MVMLAIKFQAVSAMDTSLQFWLSISIYLALKSENFLSPWNFRYALLGAASFLGGSMRITVSLCVIMVEISNNLKFLPLIMLVLLISKVWSSCNLLWLYSLELPNNKMWSFWSTTCYNSTSKRSETCSLHWTNMFCTSLLASFSSPFSICIYMYLEWSHRIF